MLSRILLYLSVRRNFHTRALKAAPTNGATMKSQSCSIACPPSIKAGPMLRAGFTEVPVIGIHTMWINISVSPMASPARLPAPFFSSVAPKATSTKIKVNTASARNACPMASGAKLLDPSP